MLDKNILKDKKLIIFDMDGTLIDSIGIWNEVDISTVEYYTNIRPDENEINRLRDYHLRTSPDTDIYRYYISKLCEKYNIKEDIDEVYKKRKWFGEEIPRIKVKYKNNAKELLLKLKELGYILAIATTTTRGKIDMYSYENINTKDINLYEIFDIILTKEDVENKKPDPEVLNKILDRLKIKPSQAFVFEDSVVGIQTANNAGIDVVAVYDKYADYERDTINKLVNYNIKDFKEILEIL